MELYFFDIPIRKGLTGFHIRCFINFQAILITRVCDCGCTVALNVNRYGNHAHDEFDLQYEVVVKLSRVGERVVWPGDMEVGFSQSFYQFLRLFANHS